MKASVGSLAFGLLLSAALPVGDARAADPDEQVLLERANYWRLHQRPELAGDILDRVLALNPRQTEAIYQRGVLALQQQDRPRAQQCLDRLRQLAAEQPLAAALADGLIQQAAIAAVTTAATAAPATAASAPAPTPAPSADAPLAPPVRTAAPTPAPAPARTAAARRPAPQAVFVTADSDDLVAAPAASRMKAAAPRLGEAARAHQLASLQTISDDDTPSAAAPAAAGSGGSGERGVSFKPIQVAQVELSPPPPVGGYQRPINVPPYTPNDTLDINIDRDLTLLQAQANPSLVAGLGVRAHGGASGTTELTEFGAPIEATFSPWYTGTARLSVFPVFLATGSVASNQLGLYGANPILTAAGLPSVGSGNLDVGGVGILGGYSYGDFSGQFGTSPLGFVVTNLIGNVAYSPKFFADTLTLRLEGFRQPMTDSVLSYAGTHVSLAAANAVVPAFGSNNQSWGGVVRTGGRLSAFYDNQMYGAYGGVGLSSLTGVNVADNSAIDAMLGTYFRPWKTDDWAIRVGISLYYTGYDKNLSGFTLGQGGYFSPQNFESITFPVEYTGHADRWSWLASAAIGVQHLNTDATPVFPRNPSAQAALQASGSTAFLSGSSSTGPGFNLRGQIEYALDNTTSIGAAASLDNGKNYTEGIGKIYLRKTFDWFDPMAIKTDPVSTVARDQPMSHL